MKLQHLVKTGSLPDDAKVGLSTVTVISDLKPSIPPPASSVPPPPAPPPPGLVPPPPPAPGIILLNVFVLCVFQYFQILVTMEPALDVYCGYCNGTLDQNTNFNMA